MNESRVEFSHSANLQEVSVVLQTQSHYENRSRSSKQHLFSVSLRSYPSSTSDVELGIVSGSTSKIDCEPRGQSMQSNGS